MAVTVELFRLRFPEFSDEPEYSDPRIQLFIDDTLDIIGSDEARWKGKYDRAQAYLAAHLLAIGTKSELGDTNSNSGSVQSKSAGGVSISRSVVPKDRSDQDDFFMSTTYGQQYMNIRNYCFAGVAVANCL